MEFVRRNRVLLSAGGLLLVSVLLFSTSVRTRPHRDPVGQVLLDVLAPFQAAVSGLGRRAGQLWSGYVDLVDTQRRNEHLRDRVTELEAQMRGLGELERENARLAELLSLRAGMPGQGYGARVIARDPGPMSMTVTIDRGERDGVRRGMAVVAPEGVVGRVAEAGRTASRVVLITDHNSGVDAIVERSRARGVVQGGAGGACHMNYLSRDADIVPGDRVLTSGLDGTFPKGLTIGEVTEVSRRHRGLLQAAEVRPGVALDRIEEVLVIDAGASRLDPPN